jgi:mono/diheme cytochrome c family protein
MHFARLPRLNHATLYHIPRNAKTQQAIFLLRAVARALACAMQRFSSGLFCCLSFSILAGAARISVQSESWIAANTDVHIGPRSERTSPLDLEIGGDIAGIATGTSAYLAREDLLLLPQVTYTVDDDPNFKGSTKISGVMLKELQAHFSAAPRTDLIIALCSDKYHANYPQAYLAAHEPILVLKIDDEDPAAWPKDPEGHGLNMGPYMISHAKFTPSFEILSHRDESQIPWGVVRIEFRDEASTFGAIAPKGPNAQSAAVQAGYRIAQQNCFRCHNSGDEGGQKAARPWLVLSTWANASPEYFAAYTRDPKSTNPRAQMPGFPGYDDKTLQALTAYFRTFNSQEKP